MNVLRQIVLQTDKYSSNLADFTFVPLGLKSSITTLNMTTSFDNSKECIH